ncbi:MAG TPA: hypothetical protein VF283_01240 [Bryobacteraceae bacterium]
MRLLLLFLLSAVLAFGQQAFKLYLKDGDYQLVSKYQVEGNTVRYYSTERYQWEEIPLNLVDVAKTKRLHQAAVQSQQEINQEFAAEAQAKRALEREIASIPDQVGVYYKVGGKIEQLPSASFQVVTDKKRAILKHLSPIPIVPGKASVVIDGSHSKFIVHSARPQFFLRPEQQDQFGIAKLTPKKDKRIVESVSITPVINQDVENRKESEIFTQQLGENLFKIWPEKPLTPGEYAVVEYTGDTYSRKGDVELLVWDFAYKPSEPRP